MRRTELKNVLIMLRHRSNGLSLQEIASTLGCSKATVSGVLKRADEVGIQWPLPDGMKDDDVEAALWPSGSVTRTSSDRLEANRMR